MKTVKERLIEFISYLEMGQGKFEKACGLSNGFVTNIRDGFSTPNLYKITSAYPELNINWLITGEGKMLNGQPVGKTTKLAEVISELNITNAQFAEKIGVKEYSVEKMLSGELPIGSNTLRKLKSEFNINPEWITRNKGAMFIESKTSPINVDGELTNTEMEKEIKRLRASIDALIEKNERLEAELAKYREKHLNKEITG